MDADVFVPFLFFGFLTAIILVPAILRNRDRARMHDTLRAAFERGQPVPPEMIEALQRDARPVDSPTRDLRRGVILLFLALGLSAMGFAFGRFADEARYAFTAFAAVPGFIGLGFIVLWVFGRGRKS